MCKIKLAVTAAALSVLTLSAGLAIAQAQSTAPASTAPAPVTGGGLTGEDILGFTCTGCHSVDVIKSAGYKADQWPSVIDTMIGRGATVAPEDRKVLEAYLAANFSSSN